MSLLKNEFFVEVIDERSWLTDVYSCKFFNEFVKSGFKKDILKRIIVNELTGSSWRFKIFNKLSVNVKKEVSHSWYVTMDYLQLYAEDVDGDGDLEMNETVDEENKQDQDFIDDSSSVSFSDEASFYRGIDNSIETAASNVDKNHSKNLKSN